MSCIDEKFLLLYRKLYDNNINNNTMSLFENWNWMSKENLIKIIFVSPSLLQTFQVQLMRYFSLYYYYYIYTSFHNTKLIFIYFTKYNLIQISY